MKNAALSGPRILFRQIREVMAGKGEAERRLQDIVQLIASNSNIFVIQLMADGTE